MVIDKYTVASIAYTMTTDNNRKIIEIIRSNHPKSFFFGAGTLLPSFEKHLTGLKEGDSFDFSLSAEEAYGPKDPFAIMEIPKDTFSIDGKIQENMFVIGNDIPMADDQGNKHIAVILEVKADEVLMDFNHPLAGKAIKFKGEVKSVRVASQEEIDSLDSSCGSGGCGCKSEKVAVAEDADCAVCGNPPEDQGKGIGDCKCI